MGMEFLLGGVMKRSKINCSDDACSEYTKSHWIYTINGFTLDLHYKWVDRIVCEFYLKGKKEEP